MANRYMATKKEKHKEGKKKREREEKKDRQVGSSISVNL